jgi:hypothetical protein
VDNHGVTPGTTPIHFMMGDEQDVVNKISLLGMGPLFGGINDRA